MFLSSSLLLDLLAHSKAFVELLPRTGPMVGPHGMVVRVVAS